MSLRIRAVRLRARTEHAAVGSTIQFADGLNVVRAGNSSGKSQILQAIAFSLGVEGMFGPGRQVPLGSAMTDEVTTVEGGRARSAAVLASWCAVEIENARGDKVVAQRFAKHDRVLPNLVRVWHSPVLSAPPSRLPEPDAMFVREPGAAQNDRGFHRFLESFIGWELPRIPRYAGGDAPLYLEVLFPYLYVDQRA